MVFSHDGLHDSLTALAAPPYFYESVKREFALAERTRAPIVGIILRLTSELPIYEHTIVTFADLASKSFRFEDHLGRLSYSVFVALIQTDEVIATQIVHRLIARWGTEGTPEVILNFAICQRELGELPLDFLNRLDEGELQKLEF